MEYMRTSRPLRLGVLILAFAMIFTAFSFSINDAYGATKPAQVKNLKLSKSTASSLKVSWSSAKSAKKYQVAYKQVGAKKYTYKTTSKKYYTISKLKTDTTYCVKVRGVKGDTKGKWSSEKKYTTKVDYAKASNESKMKVSVTGDKVKVSISKLGLKGTATVYGMGPNEYLSADKISGIVTKNNKGRKIGTVSMSSTKTKTFTFDRYADGYDRAYDKYYLVYDGTIIKGPVYATSIASESRKVTKKVASKKGLVDGSTDVSFEAAEDLGISWTALNIDFTQLVLDDDAAATQYAVEHNGKTYYFNESYVNKLDYRLSRYEEMGINVVAILISFTSTEGESNYPDELKYIDDARWTNGFNTSTTEGRDYFTAAMEFLADRYSAGGNGLITNYVIGNEIDYAYDWYEVIPNKSKSGKKLPARNGNMDLRSGEIETTVSLDKYMEEYARTLRIANTAVKQYSKEATVSVSFTRDWGKSIGKQSKAKASSSKRYDSYAGKDVISWLNFYTKKGGDFDWALTPHNYPMVDGDAAAYETKNGYISGNPDKTTKLTQNNLEVLQVYLNRSVNKYNGKLRSIYLTENGSSSGSKSGTHSATMQKRQAAAVAQHYYRTASMPSVKAIAYYRLNDRESEGATDHKVGLIDTNGKKKLSYEVWKYIDTDKSFKYADKYLGYITFKKNGKTYSKSNGRIKSYKDVMKMTSGSFDWDKKWDKKALTPVKAD